jgi:hypothetical protein
MIPCMSKKYFIFYLNFYFIFRSLIPSNNLSLPINNIHCFGDLSPLNSNSLSSNTKFSSIISNQPTQSMNCNSTCSLNKSSNTYECILCLNSLYYDSYKSNDLFLIKNGLRFISDAKYPRYLFQTINYRWNILSDINNYYEWKLLYENLKTNFIQKFYSKIFTHMSCWWSSEIF